MLSHALFIVGGLSLLALVIYNTLVQRVKLWLQKRWGAKVRREIVLSKWDEWGHSELEDEEDTE